MKAIFLLLYLLFISSSALKAQCERITIRTWKDFNLKGRVKYVMEDSLKILMFTPEGNLLSMNIYGMDKWKHFTYDKAGRLLTEECELRKLTIKYTYNAQGVMIKREHFSEGKHIATDLYDIYGNIQKRMNGDIEYKNTYDAQKKIIHIESFASSIYNFSSLKKWSDIQIAYLPNGWMRYVETYNNGNKVVTELDNKGRMRFKSTKEWEDTYTYDDNDNLVEYKDRWGYTIRVYNAQNEEISYTNIDDSNEKREYRYTYPKHDVMGNWTEKVTDSSGKRSSTTRTLSYYE